MRMVGLVYPRYVASYCIIHREDEIATAFLRRCVDGEGRVTLLYFSRQFVRHPLITMWQLMHEWLLLYGTTVAFEGVAVARDTQREIPPHWVSCINAMWWMCIHRNVYMFVKGALCRSWTKNSSFGMAATGWLASRMQRLCDGVLVGKVSSGSEDIENFGRSTVRKLLIFLLNVNARIDWK